MRASSGLSVRCPVSKRMNLPSGLQLTPDRERGVVGPGGVSPDRDGVVPGAEPVDEVAGLGPRNPARVPRPVGDPAVDRRGEFERDERAVGVAVAMEKDRVLAAGLFAEEADLDFDAGRPESGGSAMGDGVGIGLRGDDLANACTSHGIDTGGLLALVSTGLEGDEEGGPAGLVSRIGESGDLGVGPAELRVPPFPGHLSLRQHDGADQRIGRDTAPAPPGELERPAHRGPVIHRARP